MTSATKRVVVFGAGGFVGGWICEELSQQPDVELVACVRKWASSVRLARRGIRICQADLEAADQVASALNRADVVINASMPPPSREAELTTNLFLAAAREGVSRFVQFSSAAVYGNLVGGIDEETAPAPIDDYSRGKADMERSLSKSAASFDMPVVILRPSIIYGPFSDAWTVRYVQRIQTGRWRRIGPFGVGTCNLVHGRDVARAVIAAATVALAPGRHIFNLNGPDVVTWNEYIERLGDALGIPDRSEPNAVSFRAMVAASQMMRMGARLTMVRSFFRRSTGAARAAMKNAQAATNLYPSAGELLLLRRQAHYLSDHAQRALGLTPGTSLDIGIRESVDWCRVHGIA